MNINYMNIDYTYIDEEKYPKTSLPIRKDIHGRPFLFMDEHACPKCDAKDPKCWKSINGVLYCCVCGNTRRKQIIRQMKKMNPTLNRYRLKIHSEGNIFCHRCRKKRNLIWKKVSSSLFCNSCGKFVETFIKNQEEYKKLSNEIYNKIHDEIYDDILLTINHNIFYEDNLLFADDVTITDELADNSELLF